MSYTRFDNKDNTGSAREKPDEDAIQNSLKPHKSFALILLIATIVAVFINFLPIIRFKPITIPDSLSVSNIISQWQSKRIEEPVEETPKVIYFQARPSVEPTPPRPITSFKLLTYGRELGPDGFTTYVDDKPVVLSVEMVPFMSHPPVTWSVSDDTAASLTVSNDKKQCEFSALRDAGRIELTVSCNEAEIIIPVYVWSR